MIRPMAGREQVMISQTPKDLTCAGRQLSNGGHAASTGGRSKVSSIFIFFLTFNPSEWTHSFPQMSLEQQQQQQRQQQSSSLDSYGHITQI